MMKFSLGARRALAVMMVLGAILTACDTVPVTGRRQLNIITADQEMQLGLTSFDQMKTNTPVNHDPAINALVQKVGTRIAAVARLPGAQWEFVVFESKEANAFCLPGGKVGVYTGILPITKDEAGLATVIGHEVAHAVARHGAERMSEQMLITGGSDLLGSGIIKMDPKVLSIANQVYGAGTQVGVTLPHSRSQESEADHIGLVYMAQAGYPPEAAVDFWKRFAEFNKQSGGSTSWYTRFLSTHPLDDARIAQLQAWLPEAKSQYRPR
jgi:predicted Zn-dependent protease